MGGQGLKKNIAYFFDFYEYLENHQKLFDRIFDEAKNIIDSGSKLSERATKLLLRRIGVKIIPGRRGYLRRITFLILKARAWLQDNSQANDITVIVLEATLYLLFMDRVIRSSEMKNAIHYRGKNFVDRLQF